MDEEVFITRRILRLIPLYYLTLLLVLAFYKDSGHFVLISFLHLSNMAPMFGLHMMYGSLWSLSVEEHFYLMWPSLVRVLSRKGLAIAALSICLLQPFVSMLGFVLGYGRDVYVYTWFRLDGLALRDC